MEKDYHFNGKLKSVDKLIISNVPTINENLMVTEIEKLLLQETKNFETINYIYVLDDNKKLVGIISIKELFRAEKTTPVKEIMSKKIVSAHPHTHQETVAHLALKNKLKAIPIVSKENVFLGIVPNDIILKTIYQETTEDMLRLGGITNGVSYDNIFKLSIFTSLKHRLPWLIVGLFGGMLAAGIVGQFEQVLSKNIILAAFIPLIVYMADAVGTQMEAFIIRDLAIDQKMNFIKYLARQTTVVLILGLGLSTLLYGASLWLYGLPQISLVLSIALLIAILTSLFTGLIVPFVFSKMRQDPANASGPVATIIQDVLSVLVYFVVASIIL